MEKGELMCYIEEEQARLAVEVEVEEAAVAERMPGYVALVNTPNSTEQLRSVLVVATLWYSKRHGCALPEELAQVTLIKILIKF